MTDDARGATIAKRRLADLLSRLRLDRGLTATQVCQSLGWGRGKLGRFESNRWKRPEISDIRDLLRLYRVGQDERDEMIDLALLARRRPWWREYGDVFDGEYPGFENDADEIRLFSPLTLPVLLQTPRYAELQLRAPAGQGVRSVEATLRRQRILLLDDAPTVTAVITEAALRYDWGSAADRREQVVRLTELGSRPHIEIRLHSFTAGGPPNPSGPVTHLRFGPDDADLIFVHTGLTTTLITDRPAAESYASCLNEVVEQAYDRARTAEYLAELTRTLSLGKDHLGREYAV